MSADKLESRGFAWESLDRLNPDRVHYSVLRLSGGEGGMGALRAMFPNAVATEMNFVLFSTSGIHGSYELIEDAEKVLREGSQDEAPPLNHVPDRASSHRRVEVRSLRAAKHGRHRISEEPSRKQQESDKQDRLIAI